MVGVPGYLVRWRDVGVEYAMLPEVLGDNIAVGLRICIGFRIGTVYPKMNQPLKSKRAVVGRILHFTYL